MYKAYFDGASRGNPGDAGIGFFIKDAYDNVVLQHSDYIGHKTNNEAEYTALINLLTKILDIIPENETIHIMGDSMLIVNQVNKAWQVKQEHLLTYYNQVQNLLKQIKNKNINYIIKWIPREENNNADTLSNKGIDEKKKENTKQENIKYEKILDTIYIVHGQDYYAVDTKHQVCTCPYYKYHKTCKHLNKINELLQERNDI